MMRVLPLLVFGALLLSPLAHANDILGFDPEGTCKSAIDAEIANGAKLLEPPAPPNPVMKDFFGTIEFTRFHQGTMATVIYLCQGTKASGGQVVAQLIYIKRASEGAARDEFERQRQLLLAQFGAPCWDPANLDEHSRAKFSGQGQTLTTWRIRPGLFTDISWWRGAPNLDSTVLIGTNRFSAHDRSKESAPIGSFAQSCTRLEQPE